MAIVWEERPNSAKISSDSATFSYLLTGTADRIIADALAHGYSSALWNGLSRTSVDVEEVGPQMFYVDVHYGTVEKKEPEAGDYTWSFSTTGGSIHITQALAHIASYKAGGGGGGNPHKGAIGVTSDGKNSNIEGVDVPDRNFNWTETHQLLYSSYDWSYGAIVDALTGRVNNATFRGRAAGTVLFEGADGSRSSKDPLLLTMTYHFAYSPAVAGLTIGDVTNIAKGGWQYLWVEYKTVDTGDADIGIGQHPKAVHVEQVHYTGDFSLLGIGTGSL